MNEQTHTNAFFERGGKSKRIQNHDLLLTHFSFSLQTGEICILTPPLLPPEIRGLKILTLDKNSWARLLLHVINE